MKTNLYTKKFTVLFIIFLILCSFFIGDFANAVDLSLRNAVSGIVGHVIQFLVWILGGILFVLIYILIWVAQYNDFVNSAAVTNGWGIVRDLCNMFFILILLIIAFATILRIESYNLKKTLPKLLIMAVLINFSKTICGIFIDFAQVIMLTFVNGFKGMGSANLTTMLGIQNILAVNVDAAPEVSLLSVVGSYILALLYTIIAVIVILVLVAVLVIRMIMLWIYIVLSPLAYLLSAFPAGQKYSQQWWNEFSKQVVIGPVLAFFIWLSFISIGGSNVKGQDILKVDPAGEYTERIYRSEAGEAPIAGTTEAGTPDNMIKFIISIGMLMGGLMITQQLGGMAGSMAGSAIGKIRTAGVGAAKLPFRGAKDLASFGIDKLSEKAKIDFNVFRGWERLKARRADIKLARRQKIEKKVVEGAREGRRLSLLSHGALAWDNIVKWRGPGRFALGRLGGVKYQKEYSKAKGEREKIWSSEEKIEKVEEMARKREQLKDFEQKVLDQDVALQLASDQDKKEEGRKLASFEEQRNSLKSEIFNSMKEFKEKKVDDKRAKELDKDIINFKKMSEEYELKGGAIAEATTDAEIEATQAKKVAHIDNADQLSRILKEAIKEGNQGLIAAVSKKMTQKSDYNEMMSHLGLESGTKGMHDLARMFEKKGKMTRSSSLALVGEIGGIAKNIGHFGAFGAVRMENGRWREAREKEAQEAQLAEMLKMQPQAFARNVNRLGLGYYTSPDQKADNWQISDAAIAYLRMNSEPLADNYAKTGQQNALEHLATSIDQLIKNGIPPDSSLIQTINSRATKGGTDIEQIIKNIR